MDQAIKAEWVAALRSGEYKQGRGQLRDTQDKFCCLGVLCNIHAQHHPDRAATETRKHSYLSNQVYLPDEVMNWAGLERVDGGEVLIGIYSGLAAHNDSGCTFAEIADAIEAQL